MIKRANDNVFGLAAGVISKDIDFCNTVSRALKAGTVWVNTYNVFESAVPFGEWTGCCAVRQEQSSAAKECPCAGKGKGRGTVVGTEMQWRGTSVWWELTGCKTINRS